MVSVFSASRNLSMRLQDLDRLGIIAGIVDQIKLEERVNNCLRTHPQQIVSPGQGIKAMILNDLGFVSAPLYLYEGFFGGKATSYFLGDGIEAEHLNNNCLGRLLDKVWDSGSSQGCPSVDGIECAEIPSQ